MCSSCVSHQMASFCAYPAWYIFPRWRRLRTPTGAPLGGVNYIGTVPSCSPLVPVRPSSVCFLFPCCFPPYAHHRGVSFVVSSGVSPCRLVSCVPLPLSVVSSVMPSHRLGSSRLVVSYEHRFVLLFAHSFRLPWRSCLAFPCRLVSHWHPVCSVSSLAPFIILPVVSSCSSRFCHVISFRLVRGRLVSVLVPGSRVRAVPSCCSLVPVRLFGIGSCSWSWGVAVRHGHGAAGACSSHLIRPIIMPARYSLTRCGMALWEDVGYGAPFRVARRSSLARSCPIVLLITSDLPRPHCVLSFPHPRSKKAGDGSGGEGGIEQER